MQFCVSVRLLCFYVSDSDIKIIYCGVSLLSTVGSGTIYTLGLT